jgi:sugar lactone lactonase YvrE
MYPFNLLAGTAHSRVAVSVVSSTIWASALTFPVSSSFGCSCRAVATALTVTEMGGGDVRKAARGSSLSVTSWTKKGWNHGQVWKITPSGTVRRFGPEIEVGILSGLAIDAHQQLYAGLVAWTDPALPELLPGVVRIDARTATRVLTLPGGEYGQASFPNGLAFSDDLLYVSDSAQGSIWRTQPHGTINDQQHTPWLTSPLLAPVTNLGVNGIAVDQTGIDAVNADKGSVVRIPVKPNGSPGQPALITQDQKLVTADGVTFDDQHRLWVVTNSADGLGGSLLRVDPDGQVTTVADNPGWLNYPTQPIFGTTYTTDDTLFIANGAFNTGTANVIALELQGLND